MLPASSCEPCKAPQVFFLFGRHGVHGVLLCTCSIDARMRRMNKTCAVYAVMLERSLREEGWCCLMEGGGASDLDGQVSTTGEGSKQAKQAREN